MPKPVDCFITKLHIDFEDGERWSNQCENNVVAWMEI